MTPFRGAVMTIRSKNEEELYVRLCWLPHD